MGKELIKGFNQANTIVIKIDGGDIDTIKNAIELAKNKCNIKNMIVISEYNKVIELTKSDLLEGKYKRLIRGKI